MSTLTDEEIDSLEGRELDEAVCVDLGWKRDDFGGWKKPGAKGKCHSLARYRDDIGAAMGLLLTADDFPLIRIDRNADLEIVVYCHFFGDAWPTRIAGGPKLNAASIFCRAFLKLNGRKG